MELIAQNLTRGVMLATRVEVADSWRARLRGLLGRPGLDHGAALHLVPCSSVHMFFMRFAIDVAFLDADGTVVRAIQELKPWRATALYLSARSALELPAGTLARTGTVEGDRLRIA